MSGGGDLRPSVCYLVVGLSLRVCCRPVARLRQRSPARPPRTAFYDAPRLEASPLVVHTVMHALLCFVRRVYRGRVAVVCIMLWCVEILWLCRLAVLITM